VDRAIDLNRLPGRFAEPSRAKSSKVFVVARSRLSTKNLSPESSAASSRTPFPTNGYQWFFSHPSRHVSKGFLESLSEELWRSQNNEVKIELATYVKPIPPYDFSHGPNFADLIQDQTIPDKLRR
jgi:hypothetical protein